MDVNADRPHTPFAENPTWTLLDEHAGLLAMGRDDRRRQDQHYEHGRLLVDVFERQLWTQDEGGPYPPTRKDFVAWARQVSGTPGSESTLLRRMDLAAAFSRAEFDELLGQGRSVSALMEIAGAPGRFRRVLLDLAPECTVDDLREARKLLTRTLREGAEAADPELVAAKLALAVARSRAERARRRVHGGLCAGCGERLAPGGAGEKAAEDQGGAGTGDRERGAQPGASGVRAEGASGVRAEGASGADVARCAAGLAEATGDGAGGAGEAGTGSAGTGTEAPEPNLIAERARQAAERDIALASKSKLESDRGEEGGESKLESDRGEEGGESKLESDRGEEAGESKLESCGDQEAAGAGAGVVAAEGWWVPLTRALTADLSPEQTTELERQLVLALAGTAPATLAGLLRDLAARPPGLAPPLQADFAEWLRGALDRDLAARWPSLYCFFTTAQLPGYIQHMHLLRGVKLPEAAATELKLGCTACPLTDEPPIDIPDDADDLTARAIVLAHELSQVAREGEAFLAADTGCTVATLGRLWCVAADLTDDLAGLEADLAAR